MSNCDCTRNQSCHTHCTCVCHQTQTYRLVSAKGVQTVRDTCQAAIAAAIRMERDLQPAFGVTVEDATGATVAEVRDGRVED